MRSLSVFKLIHRNSNPKFCKASRNLSRPDKDSANATRLAECSVNQTIFSVKKLRIAQV
jgi:hypothetical protein